MIRQVFLAPIMIYSLSACNPPVSTTKQVDVYLSQSESEDKKLLIFSDGIHIPEAKDANYMIQFFLEHESGDPLRRILLKQIKDLQGTKLPKELLSISSAEIDALKAKKFADLDGNHLDIYAQIRAEIYQKKSSLPFIHSYVKIMDYRLLLGSSTETMVPTSSKTHFEGASFLEVGKIPEGHLAALTAVWVPQDMNANEVALLRK